MTKDEQLLLHFLTIQTTLLKNIAYKLKAISESRCDETTEFIQRIHEEMENDES